MGESEAGNLHLGINFEVKDQSIADSNIPLSPQWLYSKPNDTKMEGRVTTLLAGNVNDSHQKDIWRVDGSEEKRDWRRIATENETNRRWREEERETGLLGASRDRRKLDRRVDNIITRDDIKSAPSTDRWSDGSGRNMGHEARRDSKWSSRWGPEDKEKESRAEKKSELEKDREKEEIHNENQSSYNNNRPVADREVDARDKWRPRHRTDIHSGSRVAPGFGLDRGRVEGSIVGFMVGRGRSNPNSKSMYANSIYPGQPRQETTIGKPFPSVASYCYPRGKLLDIYRRQKDDIAFGAIPVSMEDMPPMTVKEVVDPLAFVAPDLEEEAIIMDIWKGKITSSEVVYNRKGKCVEDATGYELNESVGGLQGVEQGNITYDTVEKFVASGDCGTLVDNQPNFHGDALNGGEVDQNLRGVAFEAYSNVENANDLHSWPEGLQNSTKEYLNSDGASRTFSLEGNPKISHDSGLMHIAPSSGQSMMSSKPDSKEDEFSIVPSEDSYICYIDPSGNVQGPFLGADIILWLEEGYFGLDLPVRIAEAPEGTPFQSLGNLMPFLKAKNGYIGSDEDAHSTMERIMETNVQPSSTAESVENYNLPTAQLRKSESDFSSQLPYTEGANFSTIVAEDEEIIFPGRPGSSGTTASVPDPLLKTDHPSFTVQLPELGMPQGDGKIHPFGLLWSELENSHGKQFEMPEMSSNMGRSASIVSNDAAKLSDSWAEFSRQNSHPSGNSFQDVQAARLIPPLESQLNRFDLAEQLLSQQYQQQLQSRNVLPDRSRYSDALHEHHLPGQNLPHHQLLSNSASDLEQLVALQLQQQRHLQLQQQQQQLHWQQQQLLEERQQAQARQALLDQLMHAKMQDSFLAQSHLDSLRGGNILDQVLLEQQLLQEMQQRSHHNPRQFAHSAEQLAQIKYAHLSRHEQQRDLYDLLPRAQRGQLTSFEQQILEQEQQLQARQLSMGMGSRINIEDERILGSSWPGNNTDQFFRNLGGSNRSHDYYQWQQRSAFQDQLNQLDRNHSFQDRLYQGQYPLDSPAPFDRSLSLSAGASGLSGDLMNLMGRSQGVEAQDFGARFQTRNQAGASSSFHSNPRNSVDSNQFNVPEVSVQHSNDWVEARMQQLQINYERQKSNADSKISPESDAGFWMADGMNDDKAKQLLMDLLHQKSNHSTNFVDRRFAPGVNSATGPDVEGGDPMSANLLGDQVVNPKFREKFPLRSDSGNHPTFHTLYTALGDPSQTAAEGSLIIEKPVNQEATELDGRLPRLRKMGSNNYLMADSRDSQRTAAPAIDPRDPSIGPLARNASLVSAGYFDEKGASNIPEDFSANQVPVHFRDPENILLRRSLISVSVPQEGLSDLVSDAASTADSSLMSLDGDSKKDTWFRRAASEADGVEPSFIDMLKSNSKKTEHNAQSGSSDGAQRSAKKKGKKGRQIDPALLGFKVTSNRIMMGEIHRIDD